MLLSTVFTCGSSQSEHISLEYKGNIVISKTYKPRTFFLSLFSHKHTNYKMY